MENQMEQQTRVLITGGSGLVGRNLSSYLETMIKQNQIDGCRIYLNGLQLLTPTTNELNLLNYSATERYISIYQPDIVVHLAAKVGGLYYNLDNNIDMYRDNMLMNDNLLKACDKFNVQKCICCLSTCVFPDKIELPMKEEDLHNGEPHSSNYGYAHAKRQLDVLCELYRRKGREYVTIIPTNIYGKYDNFSLSQGHVIPMLIHKFFNAKKNNTSVTIWGNGSALRQFIFAEDISKIIANMILEKRRLPPRLIVSPPENAEISIKEVVDELADIFDYRNVTYDTSKPNGQEKKTVSNARLTEMYPSTTFSNMKNGLKECVDWFIENYEQARK